jgi:hypothetical protein
MSHGTCAEESNLMSCCKVQPQIDRMLMVLAVAPCVDGCCTAHTEMLHLELCFAPACTPGSCTSLLSLSTALATTASAGSLLEQSAPAAAAVSKALRAASNSIVRSACMLDVNECKSG